MTLAYLDPGSGSLIVSAVVGGAAAAGVAVKQARARVTGVFGRRRKQADETDQTPAADVSSAAAEPAVHAEASGPDDS